MQRSKESAKTLKMLELRVIPAAQDVISRVGPPKLRGVAKDSGSDKGSARNRWAPYGPGLPDSEELPHPSERSDSLSSVGREVWVCLRRLTAGSVVKNEPKRESVT
jgi:hypothetical protein